MKMLCCGTLIFNENFKLKKGHKYITILFFDILDALVLCPQNDKPIIQFAQSTACLN